MKNTGKNSESQILRHKAEELLKKKPDRPASRLSEAEIRKAIQELQVHQIELELQNEELQYAKRIAEELAKEKYVELYDFAPSGYFTLSKTGEILELNLCGSQMLGKDRSLIKNNSFESFVSAESIPVVNRFLAKVFSSKVKETCEVILPDHRRIPMYIQLTGIAEQNGNQCFVIAVDISERKQAEESLRISEEKFRHLFEQSVVGKSMTTLDGKLQVNKAFCQILGYSETELSNLKWQSITHPDDIENDQAIISSIISGEKASCRWEKRYIHKNGSIVWVDINTSLQRDEECKPLFFNTSLIDITDRRQAEESLKQSEERYRSLLTNLEAGVVVHAPDTSIIMNNRRASELLGLSDDQMKGKLAIGANWKFIHKNGTPLLPEEFPVNWIIAKKEPIQNVTFGVVQPPENNIVWLNVNGFPAFDDRGEISEVLISFIDITERLKTEEALRLKNLVFDASLAANSIANQDGIFTEANDAFLQIWGYPIMEEVVGKSITYFIKDLNEAVAIMAILSEKGEWEGDFTAEKKDSSTFIAHALATTIKNPNGKPIGFQSSVIDITERLKAEKELIIAKERAEESDQLKSAFLSNMSHEIRTPMNGILGFAELLKEPGLTGDQQQTFIRMIEKSGARMLTIINDIIDLSKIESKQMKVSVAETNINEKIEFIYTFFKPETDKKGIELYFKNGLPAKDALIFSDTEKIYAILTNLVKNAIKFTDQGSIEFGYDVVVETLHATSLPAAPMLQFYVKDTGIGIPPDRQEAIFERFIQSDIVDKMARQGAGLGLAISKAYVELLGGKIWVESKEGKGSVFYFTLPYKAVNQEITDSENVFSPDDALTLNKKLKILIAEDNKASEIYLEMIVEKFCSKVLIAKTGYEAVEICHNNPDLDLVLMDIRMPEMSGYDASRQIRKFNKNLIIVAQTAFAMAGDREKALEAGCNDYISKPIKKTKLIELVQKYF